MTNYEKIKSMSIDEMAVFMNACGHDFPPYCDYEMAMQDTCSQNCIRCAVNWLESETEPNFCTDKENKFVHCENCHEECKFDKFE